MSGPRLNLTRDQILAHRRRAGALDERLPMGESSLRRAAWAGLQDSMPRAAVLSIHARVEGTRPSTWEDPSLIQVWGPRYNVFVVPAVDRAVFTLGRYPDDARGRLRAEDLAARLHALLGERRLGYAEAGEALGVTPNSLGYASPTGTVVIRWEGARQPTVWTLPRPEVDPSGARLELARRYLHIYGPASAAGFAHWAGMGRRHGEIAFDALSTSLTAVQTPAGEAHILSEDEPALLAPPAPAAAARLLPSGDSFTLMFGADRELLVPDQRLRGELWTPRVWPGALLLNGEIAGTWRRAGAALVVQAWRRISRGEREAVESEAGSLPLPGIEGRIAVSWAG